MMNKSSNATTSSSTSSLSTTSTTASTTTTTTTTMKKKSSLSQILVRIMKILGICWIIIFGISVNRLVKYSGDPFSFLIPNFLLFTPFRALTYIAFDYVLKGKMGPGSHNNNTKIDMMEIPTLSADEYTFDKLRELSHNFKIPVAVRGIFANTTATKRWSESGYVSSHIGDYIIPVIQEAVHNMTQTKRQDEYFRDAFEHILSNEDSEKYMFFPVKSRFKNTNVSQVLVDDMLTKAINKMVREDLEFDTRLWHGFASDTHKGFVGSQFIAGRGFDDINKETTGTFWHCAIGNNWFAQVVGRKRWIFLDQEYSAYLRPQRHGIANMAVGSYHIYYDQEHLPVKYVDLEAGDLLYNPDWEWHAIQNYPGLSIGCPIRELNLTLSVQNNLQYTMMVLMNFIAAQFGVAYGLKDQRS